LGVPIRKALAKRIAKAFLMGGLFRGPLRFRLDWLSRPAHQKSRPPSFSRSTVDPLLGIPFGYVV